MVKYIYFETDQVHQLLEIVPNSPCFERPGNNLNVGVNRTPESRGSDYESR